MSPKIFSVSERENLRVRMLEAGFPLLKEHGMTHMSVDRITAAAGIGKSTFYNFFPSKEAFVYELICHERKLFLQYIEDVLHGREKMTETEGREIIKKIIFSENSIYQYLTPEDERKLIDAFPKETKADIDKETKVMDKLFSCMENVRKSPDYPVIANLLKIMAMAAEGKDTLHEEGYSRTQEKMFELLFHCIFEKNG